MTPQELRAFCLSFNAAVEEFPFSPEISVFKVLREDVRADPLDGRPADGQPQVRPGRRGPAARGAPRAIVPRAGT